METTGQKIKRIRMEHGLSQKELAAMVDTPPTALFVPTINVSVMKLFAIRSISAMNNNLGYLSHPHTSLVCLSPAS